MQQRDAKGRFASTAQKRNTTTPDTALATATTDRPTRIVIVDTTDDNTTLKVLGMLGATLGQ